MENTQESETITIKKEEAGQRLDSLLAQHYAGLHSRTYFQNLIDEGFVLLNGEQIKKRVKPQEGDELEVNFVLTKENTSLTAENIPLDIIYEDDDLLIVNKPPGMVVHPATGNWSGTFVNALLYHCKTTLPENESLRPGIVHRLDKDTSGLLIAAKTTRAHQGLINLFSQRKIYKEYLAICSGNPGVMVVDAPIGRHPVHRQSMTVVDEGGREAITRFETITHKENISLVRAIPQTGRTHQIRVHLKYRGFPVVGDAMYGSSSVNKKYGESRHLLHAYKLKFDHPVTHKQISVVAPPPKDFERLFPPSLLQY
jgi:23S rRNA pseudouridine1911/1915/1917 synthase